MLNTLPCRELICGFVSGKDELLDWEPSDLFQFCNDTTPITGSLDEVMAVVDDVAVNRAIKNGACNIIAVTIIAFIAFMVIGRLVSGVHWFTDIVGGALLSSGLVMMYYSVSKI